MQKTVSARNLKCQKSFTQPRTTKEFRDETNAKGPYLNDVRKIFGILDTPLVRISRNLSVLFVRQIRQFFNPPPPLSADVI